MIDLPEGGKVLICGNGGLAAESEHFAAELMGKFAFDVYIPCIALTANSSLLTALANDNGFEDVFAHQVRVWGREGDLLIAMTTSKSKNVLLALEAAQKMGMKTVALFSAMYSPWIQADWSIPLEGKDVAEIQNNAIVFLHNLAYQMKEKRNGRIADRKPEQSLAGTATSH